MATARVAPAKIESSAAEIPVSESVFDSFYWLVCQAKVEIPVPGFTVGDLLALTPGAIVQTATPCAKDIPIQINRISLGSGKFEVIGERLAIRITEFA